MIQSFTYRTRKRKGALVAAKRPIMNCVNVQQLFDSIHSLKISLSLFTRFLKTLTLSRLLLLLFATSSSSRSPRKVINSRFLSACHQDFDLTLAIPRSVEAINAHSFSFITKACFPFSFPQKYFILLFNFNHLTSLRRLQPFNFKYT